MCRVEPGNFETGPERLDLTDEPERFGELAPEVPSTVDWDSLADVPFAGDLDKTQGE